MAPKTANPAGDSGAREGFDEIRDRVGALITPVAQSRQAVCAEIIGDDQASALGITARGPAPVLKLCRLLDEAGIAADMALEAYRGPMLCLRIRSIAEGAAISVDEGRSSFCRWKAFSRAAVSPSMRQTGRGAP